MPLSPPLRFFIAHWYFIWCFSCCWLFRFVSAPLIIAFHATPFMTLMRFSLFSLMPLYFSSRFSRVFLRRCHFRWLLLLYYYCHFWLRFRHWCWLFSMPVFTLMAARFIEIDAAAFADADTDAISSRRFRWCFSAIIFIVYCYFAADYFRHHYFHYARYAIADAVAKICFWYHWLLLIFVDYHFCLLRRFHAWVISLLMLPPLSLPSMPPEDAFVMLSLLSSLMSLDAAIDYLFSMMPLLSDYIYYDTPPLILLLLLIITASPPLLMFWVYYFFQLLPLIFRLLLDADDITLPKASPSFLSFRWFSSMLPPFWCHFHYADATIFHFLRLRAFAFSRWLMIFYYHYYAMIRFFWLLIISFSRLFFSPLHYFRLLIIFAIIISLSFH